MSSQMEYVAEDRGFIFLHLLRISSQGDVIYFCIGFLFCVSRGPKKIKHYYSVLQYFHNKSIMHFNFGAHWDVLLDQQHNSVTNGMLYVYLEVF